MKTTKIKVSAVLGAGHPDVDKAAIKEAKKIVMDFADDFLNDRYDEFMDEFSKVSKPFSKKYNGATLHDALGERTINGIIQDAFSEWVSALSG